MKKTLSVLLAVIMLFSGVSLFAFAEDSEIALNDETIDSAFTYALPSSQKYVVKEGTTFTVPADKNLIVSIGTTLTVEEGASLVINGRVTVQEHASLKVAGRVTNAARITAENPEDAVAQVRFPSLQSVGLSSKVYISYAFGYTGGATDDLKGLEWTQLSQTEAVSVWAPLNQYFYVRAHIIEPDDISEFDETGKYDDAKFNVYLGDVEMPYTQDQHSIKLLFSGDISYSDWPSDDAFIAERKISLRSGNGYTVYARDGRTNANEGTVYVKYGEPFSFRVEVDEEYSVSESAMQVYVVGGYTFLEFDQGASLGESLRVYPDKDGYYNIPEVKGDYSVIVLGLVKNDTVQRVSNIFEMVKNIFEMIAKFFRQFLDLFGA